MELIDPRQRAEGCRRGLMGSPGPPQRTHSQEDPSSTAAQRDTSPALLPCGSATAWLSRLTTCSQLLLASPGQVPPKVLHVLLALTLSLSSCTFPPPHPFFHSRTRVSATKAVSCSSLRSPTICRSSIHIYRTSAGAGAPGSSAQELTHVPATGPLHLPFPPHARLYGAASLTPITPLT